MALELIRTNKFKLLSSLLTLLILLCGCDGQFGNYPYDKALYWRCSNPEFSIEWFTNEYGLVAENKSVINLDNRELTVYIDFHSIFFDVLPYGSYHYDDRLLTGKWKYRNGDLVLIVKEDFIFNNEYTELVFSPVS